MCTTTSRQVFLSSWPLQWWKWCAAFGNYLLPVASHFATKRWCQGRWKWRQQSLAPCSGHHRLCRCPEVTAAGTFRNNVVPHDIAAKRVVGGSLGRWLPVYCAGHCLALWRGTEVGSYGKRNMLKQRTFHRLRTITVRECQRQTLPSKFGKGVWVP